MATLAYSRVSTDAQSVDVQLAAFEAIGYDELFTEKISGRRKDRPQFLALVARAIELRESRTDVQILVHEWTRFARNASVALDALQQLENAGCVVLEATTQQPVTLSTADGFLSVGMRSIMSEHFSRQLGDRMKRSYEYRKATGKPSGNRAPFGYEYHREGLRPGDDWSVARGAIEHFLRHGSVRGVVIWLSEQGVIRSRFAIGRWLASPTIRGHQSYKGEMVYDTHPALITEAEWQTIRYQLEQNKQLRGKNVKAQRYAVSTTFCWCGHCGRKLTSKVRGNHRYLFCPFARENKCDSPRKYCRDTWIEAEIQNAIAEAAESAAERLDESDEVNPIIVAKQSELEKLQALSHLPGVSDAIAMLQAEIEQIKTASQNETVQHTERQDLIDTLAWMSPKDWSSLPPKKRGELYSRLVAKVIVCGKEVIEVILS